ncbi:MULTISPECIES: SH3 domain-containing protein [Mogibacterium]|uniref:SH3 domain-containing protein n=1 Tax=Mogibacterium timidum TaxID=35519 RepID=A0A7Y9B184_9FIRM|nr:MULTISPECIES: SH3 domain-containing protein [Mogibacterium]NWO23898.1 SH3 domain-containing protein [Mogibacterium timidum]
MNNSLRKKLNYCLAVFIFSLIIAAFCFTDVDAQSVQNATGYVNSSIGVNVRSGASTSTSKVMGISNKRRVTITDVVFTSNSNGDAKYRWYHIKYGGRSGYIRSDFVNGVEYSAVTGRTTAALNSRLGAGTGFKRSTTFGANVNLTVLLKAKANNSNVNWYMIKYNGGYNFVCASWVNITGSIFSGNEGGTSSNTGTITPQTKPGVQPTPGNSQNGQPSDNQTAQGDFESSIAAFPEDYKVKLRALHAAHPNWKFVAKNTGIDWNTALAKESRDGVSLINGAYPLSYRDVNSYSFKANNQARPLYNAAKAGASTIGSVHANTELVLLDEVFAENKGSDDAKYVHVKTASGQIGYIQNSVTNENYSNEVSGTVKGGYTNIRKGAGTGYSRVGGANTGNKVSIVLTAKAADGVTWYKIKHNNGFAYICGNFVQVGDTAGGTQSAQTPKALNNNGSVYGTVKQEATYRMGPSNLFKEVGKIANGQGVTIISVVKNVDNQSWYKIAVSGKVYYAPVDSISAAADVKSDDASVSGKVRDYLNYRASYDLSGMPAGTFSKDTDVVVTGAISSANYTWYRLQYKGRTYYAASNWITLSDQKYEGREAVAPAQESSTNTQPTVVGIDSLQGTGKFIASGTYIPKDGSTWFNANTEVIGYYMDPRNFINENNIFMFEDLSYQPYQSNAAVSKILSGTALERNGFMPGWFVNAGQQNGMSPIALAARARQETGGGSIAITGYTYLGKTYYNPYNIGAYSDANPVMRGMEYAKSQGWDSKEKAVFGGAKFIANGYIKKGQNSVYFQKFNVANGPSRVGTHQYMTNISAGYTESISTKNSYSAYGITNESLVFIIPVFSNMPASTSLPH